MSAKSMRGARRGDQQVVAFEPLEVGMQPVHEQSVEHEAEDLAEARRRGVGRSQTAVRVRWPHSEHQHTVGGRRR